MPPNQIVAYECIFTTGGDSGSITLKLANGAQMPLPINSIQEQTLVLAMLSKAPVFYEPNGRGLVVSWRPPGP